MFRSFHRSRTDEAPRRDDVALEDKLDAESNPDVQLTRYWDSYRTCKSYELTVVAHDAFITVDPSQVGGVIDPYVIVYRKRDREGTKLKTSVCKRTFEPVWEQAMVFEGLPFDEDMVLEVKSNKAFADNVFIGSFEFQLHEVAGMVATERVVMTLEPFGAGRISLSFLVHPPVPPYTATQLGAKHMSPNALCHKREPAPYELGQMDHILLQMGKTDGFASLLMDADALLSKEDRGHTYDKRISQKLQPANSINTIHEHHEQHEE